MATKEVMIVTADEIGNIPVSKAALEEYKTLLATMPKQDASNEEICAFIAHRNNHVYDIRNLWEMKAWFEKAAESIKEVCKSAFSIGDADEMPGAAKWSKQSYTYEFAAEGDAAMVANQIMVSGLVDVNTLLNTLTPSAIAKASGITIEKFITMYPESIVSKPKQRTLTIK